MLNTADAIGYNSRQQYSQKAIAIMQSVVNAPTVGQWDSKSVAQVHKFQSSRSQLGKADGKVGPSTLGAMIGELQYVNRVADANVLKLFPYNMPSTPQQQGAKNPVADFTQNLTMPFRFERFKGLDPVLGRITDRWRAACVFKVHVGLNPLLTEDEACRYEYRQFIRGGIWTRAGNEIWKTRPNSNAALKVPAYAGCSPSIGLPSAAVTSTILEETLWKEDGEVRQPKDRFYGHRVSALVRDARCQDEWLPHQVGRDYYLSDQPSIAGTWPGTTVEVWMELYFKGFIVEVEEDDEGLTRPIRVVQSKDWVCHSQTMTLSNYFSAIPV